MTTFSPPGFRKRKGNPGTQELVFRILGESYPRTVRAIQKALHSDFSLKISYQAVRKSVFCLVAEGSVEHTRNGYQLSRKWLLHSRSYIDQILSRYRGKADVSLRSEKLFQSFEAASLYEADLLWGDIVRDICSRTDTKQCKDVISLNHYPWWLPINLGREADLWSEIQKTGFRIHFLFSKNCPSTRWAVKIYQGIDIESSICPTLPIEENCYYNVIGDIVLRAHIPPQLNLKIERLLGSKVRSENLNLKLITHLGHEKTTIQLDLIRSVPLAETLKKACRIKKKHSPRLFK